MHKKQISSLNSLEKWLKAKSFDSEMIKNAFMTIREAIHLVPDEMKEISGVLPLPAEIAEEPHTIALYSDGGCRGNPGPGAYGFVIQSHDGQVLAEGVDFESLTTNNKMELSGPINGLKELLKILPEKNQDPLLSRIKVITDSKYVVDGMKSWVLGWKARGWKKADNKAPENLELWQELDELRSRFMAVDWMWVKGHAGHPQNEYCDRKANELMDEHLS